MSDIRRHREITAHSFGGQSPYPISRIVGDDWLHPDGSVTPMNEATYADCDDPNGVDPDLDDDWHEKIGRHVLTALDGETAQPANNQTTRE